MMPEHQLAYAPFISADQIRKDREGHIVEMAELKERTAETLRQSEELVREVDPALARL